MYPEFIAIYIGLGLLTILLVTVILLLISILKRIKDVDVPQSQNSMPLNANTEMSDDRIVFCTRCSNQFSANISVCPRCGTPR